MVRVRDRDFLAFAAKSLLERLEALRAEVQGVREGLDVEPLHRMRVASRRLRSALALFGDCLPKKDHRRWAGGIRDVTRVLGEARDLDVQIGFLQGYLAGGSRLPGPRRLLLRLVQKREKFQCRVLEILDAFERSDIAGEMEARVKSRMGARKPEHPDLRSAFALTRAAAAIGSRSRKVLGFESSVDRPDDSDGLHAMRVANKRLRYAMETFASLYGDGLEEELRTVRRFHTLLGEIHDCDVWEEFLPVFIEEERRRTGEFFGHTRSFSRIERGINALEDDRRNRRRERYETFRSLYHRVREEGFWEAFSGRLEAAGDEVSSSGFCVRKGEGVE